MKFNQENINTCSEHLKRNFLRRVAFSTGATNRNRPKASGLHEFEFHTEKSQSKPNLSVTHTENVTAGLPVS